MAIRQDGVVLWRAIAEELEGKIRAGTLEAGERLPTENEFARSFNVNRHTVRRALGDLQERGLIEVTQGRGSFVRRPMVAFTIARNRRLEDILQLQQESASGGDGAITVTRADRTVSDALELDRGETVYMIEKRGQVDGQPIVLSTHYVAAKRVPGFHEALLDGASITDALHAAGVSHLTRRITTVRARAASVSEQAALELPRHAPVLLAESILDDQHGQPVELTLARLASDRVEVVFDPAHCC